ncbi:MAG TPA: alpha/beta family hydrolase [Mycobacteriales bacterium]|nr:alpha/beta family hydrolase [Mycobacteriales bacterium]
MPSDANRARAGSTVSTVETPYGAARVELVRPARPPSGLVVLGHGAGGDRTAAVLVATAEALVAAGVAVARFDQPYRVAGRRAPAPPAALDSAAVAVTAALRRRAALGDVPVFLGGKSSGARVACRCAGALDAAGVIALGFPLRPPGRPDRSRAGELLAVPRGVPVLVCQGQRDPFGAPDDIAAATAGRADVTVRAVVGGDHSFTARRADGRTTASCLAEVAAAVVAWVGDQVTAT